MPVRYSVGAVLRSIKNVFKRDTRPSLSETALLWSEVDWSHLNEIELRGANLYDAKLTGVVVNPKDTISLS